MPDPAATTADPNIRSSKKKTTKDREKVADSSSPLMVAIDILRVVVLAVIVFLSLSYYITAGESYLPRLLESFSDIADISPPPSEW